MVSLFGDLMENSSPWSFCERTSTFYNGVRLGYEKMDTIVSVTHSFHSTYAYVGAHCLFVARINFWRDQLTTQPGIPRLLWIFCMPTGSPGFCSITSIVSEITSDTRRKHPLSNRDNHSLSQLHGVVDLREWDTSDGDGATLTDITVYRIVTRPDDDIQPRYQERLYGSSVKIDLTLSICPGFPHWDIT